MLYTKSFRLEKTFEIESNGKPDTPSPPLNHAPKCHIHLSSKHLQEQRFYHPSGTPCQYLTSLCFPCTSLQLPMFWFMAVAYCPIPVHPQE